MSGRRWLVAALALTPVLFIPTCVATKAALIAAWKHPVRGAVTTHFPILITEEGAVDLVPYASGSWKAANLLVQDAAAIERAVANLKETSVQDNPEQHIGAVAKVENAAAGRQRLYVGVHREMAMGDLWSESWYETDGKRITPLYEREYAPSWTFLLSGLIAVPIAFMASAALSRLMRRGPRTHWTYEARFVRALIVAALFAAAAWAFDQPGGMPARRAATPAAWMLFWAIVAWIAWFPRWRWLSRAATLCAVTAVATGLFVLDQPQQASSALLIAFLLLAIVAVVIAIATFIERSLHLALTQLREQHQT